MTSGMMSGMLGGTFGVNSLLAKENMILLNGDSENFIFWISMILCGLGVLIAIRAGKKK